MSIKNYYSTKPSKSVPDKSKRYYRSQSGNRFLSSGTSAETSRESTPDRKNSSPIRCFSCNKPGHTAIKCKNATCYQCGRVGHISTTCRAPKSSKVKVNNCACSASQLHEEEA